MPLRIVINTDQVRPEIVEAAVAALRGGGVVAYPTETFYGLGADPRDARAVGRLFDAKGRTAARALPLIADSAAQVRRVAEMSATAARLASVHWPGPLTLVLPIACELAEGVSSNGTVAVRVPGHPLARLLAREFGFPITSTSANPSGEPPAMSAGEVARMLGDAIDVIVDGGAAPGGAASTIVDVTGSAPRLLRAGVVPWDRVLESLQ